MFTKNSSKADGLPTLKLASPREPQKNRFFSVNNSPARLDSIADLYEGGKGSYREEVKKTVNGIDFSAFHNRTGSVAYQSERKKKSPVMFTSDFSPAETHMGFIRKEENTKRLVMWEKINKLKASLNRYNDPEETIVVPTRLEVKKIINCLELLNDPASGLADLMSIVVRVLKSALFVDKQVLEPCEEKLCEDCDDDLKSTIDSCKKEGVPYYILCFALIKELISDTRRGQKLDKHYYEVEKLKEEIERNQVMIKDLNRQVKERIPPMEHKNLLQEMESLREKLAESTKEYQDLKGTYNEVVEENVGLRKQMDGDLAEIERHMAQIHALERARDNVIKETEESRKQIALMKLKIKGFKDIMDKIIIKLGNVKQQVLDLRHENEELLYQNEKLSLRAARGFESLTPRPDYRKLIEEKKFDMDIYDSTGRRQMVPTIKIVEDLLNRISMSDKEKQIFSKKKGVAIPKLIAANQTKPPQQGLKRQSISLHPPKTRPSIVDNVSPSAQKPFFVKDASFHTAVTNTSPRNGATVIRTSGEVNPKDGKASSRQHIGNEESEDESQSSDGDTTQNLTLNKSHSRNNLGNSSGKETVSPVDGAFGEETIRQANQLIDYAVNTKKAIDKLE